MNFDFLFTNRIGLRKVVQLVEERKGESVCDDITPRAHHENALRRVLAGQRRAADLRRKGGRHILYEW